METLADLEQEVVEWQAELVQDVQPACQGLHGAGLHPRPVPHHLVPHHPSHPAHSEDWNTYV